MNFDFTLFNSKPYFIPPNGVTGWLVWGILVFSISLSLYTWRRFNKGWGTNNTLLFILLLIITPLTSMFCGVSFKSLIALPLPGLPLEPAGLQAILFSAVPWVLAGGLLGPLPAAILGLLSGTLVSLWGTHSPYTPLIISLGAILFSAASCQRYRTVIYRWLRQPLLAAFFLFLMYPFIYVSTAPLLVEGSFIIKLDYALTTLGLAWLVMGIELLIAAFFAQLVSVFLPTLWGGQAPLQPSPSERSLQARFTYLMTPLAIMLVLTMIIGSWRIAGTMARDMLKSQMQSTTQIVADQIPYFLNSAQNFIQQIASDPRLYTTEQSQLDKLLGSMIKTVPFFSQLVLLDEKGQAIASYPNNDFTGDQIPIDEQVGIQMALNGVPFQYFTIPPARDSHTAQASFVASVNDGNQVVQRVLLGRVDLASNPLTRSIVSELQDMGEFNAQGMLLDDNNQILVHPDRSMIMTTYTGRMDKSQPFYDETAPDGTSHLVYYRPVTGAAWAAVISLPDEAAQLLALQIAVPMLGLIILISILAALLLNFGLKSVTKSLENLAIEADNISKGNLNQSILMEGEDEVGRLRRSFEKMRLSLKSRLDELNQLLKVSQSVAANLEMDDAVQPVLESALSMGASLARVVVSPPLVPDLDGGPLEPVRYSVGPAQNLYSDLDEQILRLTREQERLILSSLTRPRIISLTSGLPYPTSLIAFALRYENQSYGALWVAFDQAHTFSEEEIRFLATLSGQAAVAAAKARLFLSAEIGRQRLAAILASSPDPVLVTDQRNRLILANPAAWQVLGIGIESDTGQPIEKVISQKDLLDLLLSTTSDNRSAEIPIREDKVYLAAVSSVIAEGRRVGRVCLLRDITQFKALDALKSEFVSTVSHDLRTPLTLMRGYTTMLEMVGQLNDQQSGYVRKILGGVESMSRLVNNLLDLGRIEAGIGLRPELISATEVVERVVSVLQIQATQKKIQIRTEFPVQGSKLMVEADPALLQQALQNLVENAIKYTKNEGKVTVRVQPQTERVIFEVSDTGIGISPMDQPRLFDRFIRLPQTGGQENQGSGLGLAIVRSIAERHCGQVWVESQLGQGSTFYLAIPLSQINCDG